MATEVDIYNLALAHIGDRANVADVNEASAQAAHCRRFYPMARDTLLTAYPWIFAIKRVLLAELTNDLTSWDYRYAIPGDSLRVLAVLPNEATNDHEGSSFILENGSIYTNEYQAEARYIYRQTSTGLFSQNFVNALSRLLASHIAGPIIKGREGRNAAKEQLEFYAFELELAKRADANQKLDSKRYIPAGIAARGEGAPDYLVPPARTYY